MCGFPKLIFAVVISTALSVSAQTIPPIEPARIFSPSPEPARIAQYGMYGISYYVGRPQISVPIYMVATGSLNLPISLNYESTGNKPDDLASWTGSGWMLSAGGVVTRMVVDKPDEYAGGYLEQTNIPYLGPQSISYNIDVAEEHNIETEPDRYYFSFNGRSGEFSFDEDKEIFQVPLSAMKITPLSDGFLIVDESGTRYEFRKAEYSSVQLNGDDDIQPNCPTSWWLTTITSADGSDQITFSYEEDPQEEEYKPSFSAVYGSIIQASGSNYEEIPRILNQSHSITARIWHPQRLAVISYKDAKVVFNRVSDRQDGGSSRLESIDIFHQRDGTFQKLKSFALETSEFEYTGLYSNSLVYYSGLAGRYRLMLDALKERNAANEVVGVHTFQYSQLPGNVSSYRGTFQQDYWGYFNGATVNDDYSTLMPVQQTDDLQYTFGHANREPDEESMKAGTLSSITYPTGGSTTFNWEAHRFLVSENAVAAHTISATAHGNSITNNPQPTVSSIPFTLAEADANAVVTVTIPNYPTTTDPYENPAFQTLAENTRPNVSIINTANDEVVFTRSNITPSSNYSLSTIIELAPGTYKLVANCYVNDVSASADITVVYHTTTNNTEERIAGGLRIKNLVNKDVDESVTSTETYQYGSTGYGQLSLPPEYLNTRSYSRTYDFYIVLTSQNQQSNSNERHSTVRKVYRTESMPIMNLAAGSSVVYPVVTRYTGNENSNIGKTVYTYKYQVEMTVERFPPGEEDEYMVTKLGWRYPVIENESVYKNISTTPVPNYVHVKETINEYDEAAARSIKVLKIGYAHENVNSGWFEPEIAPFYNSLYRLHTAVNQQTAKITKDYDVAGQLAIETRVNYEYDQTYHSLKVAEEMENSQGEIVRTESRYPFQQEEIDNLSVADQEALTEMVSQNIVGTVVEIEAFRNNNSLYKLRNNYKKLPGSQPMVKPGNIAYRQGEDDLEVRQVFGDYDDQGNLLSQHKVNDVNTVYLWGYGKTLPIAEAINCEQSTDFVSGPKDYVAHVNAETNGILVPFGDAFVSSITQTINPTIDLYVINGSSGGPSPANLKVYLYQAGNPVAVRTYVCAWGSTNIGSISIGPGEYHWYYDASLSGATGFTGYNINVNFGYEMYQPALRVFHTSFEEEGLNNANAVTGRKVYVGTYHLPLTRQPGTYNLEYWRNSGSGWQLTKQVVTISGASPSFMDIGESNVQIDELRFYPTAASIKTYTYDVHVGLTSFNDENNKVTYYKYDDVQRLRSVSDYQGNVLKVIDYHYQTGE